MVEFTQWPYIYFKVIDEYTLFYLYWIEPESRRGYGFPKSYWSKQAHDASWYSWAGYAFEEVCLKHVEHIRRALGLENQGCQLGSWRFVPKKGNKEEGAQSDLLFDRDDDAISLCEIKYSNQPFKIDKDYAKKLSRKIDVYRKRTKTTKQIFLFMITANGLKKTMYSEDLITSVVALDD